LYSEHHGKYYLGRYRRRREGNIALDLEGIGFGDRR
jgi:hypothetical protein